MTDTGESDVAKSAVDEPTPTPYGHEWVVGDTAPAWVQEFTPELRERAKRKMNDALDNADKPSGIEYKVYWRMPIMLGLGVVIFSMYPVLWLNSNTVNHGFALGMLLGLTTYYALVVSALVLAWFRTRLDQPTASVRRLFEFPDKVPATWDLKNKFDVVLKSDRDGHPRHTRFVPTRVPPTDEKITFEGEKLQTYWKKIFPNSYFKPRLIRFRKARVDQVSPDIVAVELRGVVRVCAYGTNTLLFMLVGMTSIVAMQLQTFLNLKDRIDEYVWRPSLGTGFVVGLILYVAAVLLIVCVPWLLVKIPTSKIHPFPIQIRKLLVRQGDDWLIFNGELQGPEECDLSWLRELLAEREASNQAV